MPFSIPLLAAALGLAVVAVLTAGTDPAWRGASFSCVEALRHD
jgi:ABC-type lipoprotein release transport system permease subunit